MHNAASNAAKELEIADIALQINANDVIEAKVVSVSRSLKLEDQLAYVIASVNRRLEEQLEEALRPQGLPLEQFRVLSALDSTDGRAMGELAAAVLIDPATLTKIIDRMVADALVYRAPSPQDRRRVLIFTASKGKALYQKIKGVTRDQQRGLLERLDKTQAEELTRMLRGLVEG